MILGIDLGGTFVKFGIVNRNHLLKQYSIPTEKEKGHIQLINRIIEKAREIREEVDFESIGIGMPGAIDSQKGIVLGSSNLKMKNVPIADMIRKELGVPVTVGNDANCAVCGELHVGKGRQFKNFVMVTLGTGVGGGIIIDGKMYGGIDGRAGEIGHMIIKYDGLECTCGQNGCLEQYASVTALIRQTKEAIALNPDSLLAEMGKDEVTGKTAFDAKQAGCPVATKVIDQYATYLAVGLSSLTRIFMPDAIILGGAISAQGDNLLIPLREKLSRPVDVYISELGNNAGILGAAALAAQK